MDTEPSWVQALKAGAYESVEQLADVVRDPNTDELLRGMARVELASRKAQGVEVPDDVLES